MLFYTDLGLCGQMKSNSLRPLYESLFSQYGVHPQGVPRKVSSECSLTMCKLRFFADFCLVLKENPIRAKVSFYSQVLIFVREKSEKTSIRMIFNQYLILKPSGCSVGHCGAFLSGLAKKSGWFTIAILSITLVYMPGAGAVIQMDHLYEAEAVVEGQGQGISERRRAFKSMLKELLIRISGSKDAVLSPVIINALKKPDKLVQQYRYFQKLVEKEPQAEQVTEQIEEQAPESITILWSRFDKKAIINLLQQSELPVWQDIRPATLVWLAMDYDGQRYLLGNDDENQIRKQLGQHADRRGVPLLFPLMDMEDQQKISFADIWGGFPAAIHDASKRYATEAMLVVRILQDRDGAWNARWNLYDTQGKLQWQYTSEQVEELLGEGIDGLADRLGELYSVYEGEQLHTQVLLNVSGVNSLQAYARVQQYLNTISVISEKRLVQLKGGQLQFRLELKGETSSLTQAFALKDVLASDLASSLEALSEQGVQQQRLQEQELQEQLLQKQLLQEQLLQEERFSRQGVQQQTAGQRTGKTGVPIENRSVPVISESRNVKPPISTELYYRLRP